MTEEQETESRDDIQESRVEQEDSEAGTKDDALKKTLSLRNDGCGFFFHFESKRGKNWVLSNDPRNSIGRGCYTSLESPILYHKDFVATLMTKYLKAFYSGKGHLFLC